MNKVAESNALLNVLCLEDVLKDAELLNEILADSGFKVSMDIAEGEKEYLSFLQGRNYDIILADYTLPGFNAPAALELAKKLQPEVPFICVSGTISEDLAVELLKQGAVDYVLKERPGRLPFAVRRALEGAVQLKERNKAETKTLRLMNELEVEKVKLEMQGEELVLAKEQSEDIAKKYAELYDFAPTGYFTLSKEGEIIELNLSGAMMLGRERSRLINSNLGFFITKETLPVFNAFLKKVIKSKTKKTCEVTLSANGNLPLYALLTGIVTSNGEQSLVTMVDVTEHKKKEATLIISEIRYRRLFESARDGILILEAETGKILDVNPFLIEMLGCLQDEFTDKTIWEIGFFKDIVANHDKFLEFQKKRYVRFDDLPIETADGRKINVEFVSNVYSADHHKVIQCNIRDITKRKRAENDLIKARIHAEESDRLKSAFLANMNHEIRTPMNGILGFAGLLKEAKLTGEEQQEYISIIEQSGVRMLDIISDIMNISKVESGQMRPSVSVTNVNQQIEHLYTYFKPMIEQKEIRVFIKTPLPLKEAFLKTDREKIYTIFTSLIKNAIKFTDTGTIEFGYIKKDNYLEFFVKDSGIGVRPEQKEFIFERFRRGNESYNRNYEGAGLGLAISKAYVEMLGGKIRVESEPGKGSVFYFTLPYNVGLEEEPVTKNVVSAGVGENQVSNLKILIVEDDKISERLLTIAIKKFSREILLVRTGVEAVEACTRHADIDLILMDIQMPVMDGYEAIRQIRRSNKKVIIITQTAFALSTDRDKAFEAGCDDYISKPIDKALLTAMINKYFKK